MAGIQQAFNQILYTGTIATGLYAHTPEGQAKAKIRELDKQIKGTEKQWEIAAAAAEYIEDPTAMEKVAQKHSRRVADLQAEKYKLQPTEKAYRNYMEAVAETRAQKAGYKDRISYLTAEQWKEVEKAKGMENKYTKKEGGNLNNGK